ncbi:MAG: RnfABCDGE type electron transport complex subunit D [Spirochaetales bacterium]|nr:RnfABCDGE type electron transport complex subunit D [Spirochaetales bacterium]
MTITGRNKLFSVFTNLETPVFFVPSHYALTCALMTAVLLPVYGFLVSWFGWKIVVLLGLSLAAGFVVEYLGARATRRFTGYFGYPAWLLFPLVTPPGMELWMSALCLALALVLSVILFGGFGHHLFHPVVAAQVFVMINFQAAAVAGLRRPFIVPGYGFSVFSALLGTKETTLEFMKTGGVIDPLRLLFGPNVGFFGDALPLALLCAGAAYLLLGGVNRLTPIAFVGGLFVFATLGNLIAPTAVLPFVPTLLGGSAVLYAFFIFSDRWTSAKSRGGRVIAGAALALFTVLMRSFSSNLEGIMFAALLTCVLTPLADELVFTLTRRKGKASA